MKCFVAVVFVACSSVVGSAAFAAQRPNILWITAEDLSPNLGCYGDAYADTPHLDRLAAGGTRYTNFFAESPMCAPSRAVIITGMHNGPLGTSQMRSNHRIPSWVRPFTCRLREAGYYCVNNAKTDYNLARYAGGENAEFVDEAWDESGPRAHWRRRPEGKPFFCVMNYMDTHQSRASRDDYSRFVDQVQSRLPPGRRHDPSTAPLPPHYPDGLIARRTVARYYDCISTLDDFVGSTLDELREDGLVGDTIVFFYSDHGAGLPTGKACVSDFGLRCPLIVSFPEKYRELVPTVPGPVCDRLVCFADLAPTILNLLDLPVTETMQGRPFLGRAVANAPRFAYGTRDRMDETLETTRWISDGRFLLVRAYRRDVAADQQSLTSYYNGHGELCREIRGLAATGRLSDLQRRYWSESRPAVSLFDSREDPWNLYDLAAESGHHQRVVTMEQELERTILRDRDLGFLPEPDLTDAEKFVSAFESARLKPAHYPLELILETAKLADQVELRSRLHSEYAAVRYWAVVALAVIGEQALTASADVEKLLRDSSVSVRIEAAFFVARRHEGESLAHALNVLVAELENDNEFAAARAARALELIGEKARAKREAMRNVLKDRSAGFLLQPKGPRAANYGLEFSLLSALEKFEDLVVPK